MRITDEMIAEDEKRWHARDVVMELDYCSTYMRDRKDITNLDIRFYAYIMRKARDLLKAQEPRVMTLEEIDNMLAESSEEYNKIFWAEVKSRTRYSFGVFQLSILDDDDYEALLLGCSWSALYRRSSYGIRWRCWTSRPTDEQREATPWEN